MLSLRTSTFKRLVRDPDAAGALVSEHGQGTPGQIDDREVTFPSPPATSPFVSLKRHRR